MDQYPDEDEEFDLRYQEELELLDEIQQEENYEYVNPASAKKTNENSKMFVDYTQPSTSKGILQVMPSPQFSQISYGFDDTAEGVVSATGPVNRKLFGTPKGPQRGSSTPLAPKQRMAPIQEVVDLPSSQNDLVAAAAVEVLQNLGLRTKRRRLEKDLFGDIDDLDGENTYVDPIAKKARTEEQRDLELIERILETRRKFRESGNNIKQDNLSRLKAVHAFKMRNLSYSVPQWPFLPMLRSDDERIYVRYHSEEYETRAVNDVNVFQKGYGGLLGESKQQIWSGANEIFLKNSNSAPNPTETTEPILIDIPVQSGDARLWVEKYKPKKYIDLLSDEATNRSLLYWLKMWDKVVFGKEFKNKENIKSSDVQSFNKKTGRFESNGNWKLRKQRQNLNTNVDDLGRPIQKIALLCGPPGLGKTTLAHTIASHAGYQVRELNASDDRSPDAFKLALENGTQMSSVLNNNKRPNCIILDEIDGAPKQSIEFLIKFVTDNVLSKVKAKGAKSQRNILKRPIICICNDVYEPALRQLRQIAFVVSFPQIDSTRLADRLLQIARKEKLKTDFSSLITLAEKSGNDVRSCISTMQFFNAQKKILTLHDVLNTNLGQKDRHQGLFDVWGAIFRVQRPKKQLEKHEGDEEAQITMTDMSVKTRVRNVLDALHSGGDYERLMQGVYENYLQQKMPDPNLNGIVEATQWFCFTDSLNRQINQLQNYAVYPYLQYGFVIWHLLFASLAWPKINFPTKGFEFHQKTVTQNNIFQAFRKGISCGSIGVGQGSVVLVETVPLLKRILSPQIRSVAVQLLSPKEHYDLRHTVDIMADFSLTYIQARSAEGPYVFQMEPDLDALSQYPGFSGISLTYFGRQLISREVDLEKMRRAAPKSKANNTKSITSPATSNKHNHPAPKPVPNHLQRLKPKNVEKNTNGLAAKDVVSKDFFGRMQHKTPATIAAESQPDPIVKSPVWYRYKEGFNNAVRKDIHLNELL